MPLRRADLRRLAFDPASDEAFALAFGAPPGWDIPLARLEAVWRDLGSEAEATVRWGGRQPGRRSWGWWVFDVGEEPPDRSTGQAERLLELGELDDAEIGALLDDGDTAAALAPFTGDSIPPAVQIAQAVRRKLGLQPLTVETV